LEGVVLAVKKARTLIVLALLVAVTCSALPAMASWDPEKQKNLGQDHVKMQWYILDYGAKSDGTPFSIARKYYTNEKIKQDTVELLMSKFGYSAEVAGSLYFTEYEFEYTADGKEFATTYLRHYDMLGNEIHGTVYDNSSEAAKKVFAAVDPNSTPGKGVALAIPKPAPARRR
jgi:hypothetical protein